MKYLLRLKRGCYQGYSAYNVPRSNAKVFNSKKEAKADLEKLRKEQLFLEAEIVKEG